MVVVCEVAIGKVGGTNRRRPRGPLKAVAPLLKMDGETDLAAGIREPEGRVGALGPPRLGHQAAP